MIRSLLLSCALVLPPVVHAQEWPVRPLRLIVPAPPGGAPDAIARIVGQRLGDRLGQQVVIDNRGGGGGIIGAEAAAKTPPDGYTLVLGYAGPFSINPALQEKLSYDAVKDFAPITMLATSQNILVVHPTFAPRSIAALIALAKARPGQINYASGGTGQSTHLSMELLMLMGEFKLTHIPYKGAGPALADALGGRVQAHFISVPPALPHLKSGKLVAIGVTGTKRIAALPDVPTIAEAGLPGYSVETWYGLFTRAGTPAPIVTRMHSEAVAILKTREIEELFERQGLDIGGGSAGDLAKFLEAEIAKWRRVIKAAGIKPE
jgi:tripartite-type tricarboxylate transporter receptor subunit TctC